MLNKAAIRKEYLKKRQLITVEEAAKSSQKLLELLKDNLTLQKARNIVGFSPIHNEPDLNNLYNHLLKEGKNLLFLRIYDQEMKAHSVKNPEKMIISSKYNIPEPNYGDPIVEADDIDLILVPGIIFDLKGHRIGFGGGYYDRFLAKTKAYKLGVCFDFQIIDNIPSEEHDIPLDELVSPSHNFIF